MSTPVTACAEQVAAAWTLSRVRGLSPRVFRRLVDRHGSASEIVRVIQEARTPSRVAAGLALSEAVRGEVRVRELARRLAILDPVEPAEVERVRGGPFDILAYGCPGYPRALSAVVDPPPILFVRGPRLWESGPALAVVGTRGATAYGRRVTRRIVSDLARRGVVVVSGMAVGIDACAHRASLDASGRTVGVLGTGLDREYPAANRSLYRRMREAGTLITEYEAGVEAFRGAFPRRNRIIAGLSSAVLVVEAGEKSGALITAGFMEDVGGILAVPGPIDSRYSVGPNGLIADGCTPITSAEDVVAALGWESRLGSAEPLAVESAPPGSLPRPERAVLGVLEGGSVRLDDLSRSAGLELRATQALLTRLELQGYVEVEPGGRIALASMARGGAAVP